MVLIAILLSLGVVSLNLIAYYILKKTTSMYTFRQYIIVIWSGDYEILLVLNMFLISALFISFAGCVHLLLYPQ